MVMRWLSFWKALIPPAIAPLTLWMAVALAGPGGVIEVGGEVGPTSAVVDVGGGTEGVDDGGEDGGSAVEPTPAPKAAPAPETTPAPAPEPTPTPAPEPTPTPAPAPKLVSLPSVADAHVKEAQPDNSSKNIGIMTVRSEIGKNYRSFVRFDTSNIPAGASVNSATLTLCAVMVGSQRTYEVRRVTQTWGEASVTWNNQPTAAAAATASATTPLTPGCMTWDVSADVQAWVNGTGNFGWRVNDRSEDGAKQSSTDFRTSEDTLAPGQLPKLEVTYSAQ